MSRNVRKREIGGLEVLELPGDPASPTIILLHGFGANAEDLAPLSHHFKLDCRPTWLFPNAPLEIPIYPGYTGRAWFPIDMEAVQRRDLESAFPKDLAEARRPIERLAQELHIPRSKLILGGFSQGAVLSLDMALHGGDSMGALLIFSGTLICEQEWQKLSPLQAKTPFFQSHGTNDPILPLKRAEQLATLLQTGGWEGELHTFQGGHEIPQIILLQLNTFLSKILA